MEDKRNSDLVLAEQVFNHFKGKYYNDDLINELNLNIDLINEIISYDKLNEEKSIKVYKDVFENISFYKTNHYKYKELLGDDFSDFFSNTIEIKPIIAMIFLNKVYNETDEQHIEFYFALLYLKSAYEDYYKKNIEIIEKIDFDNPIEGIDKLISDGTIEFYVVKHNKLLKINNYNEAKSSKSIFYFDDTKEKLIKQEIGEFSYKFYDYSKKELKNIRGTKLKKREIAKGKIKHEDLLNFYETNFTDNLIEIVTSKERYSHYSKFQVDITIEIYDILQRRLNSENYDILYSITGFFCAYLGIIDAKKENLSGTYKGYDIIKIKNKVKYIIEKYGVE